MASSRPQLAQMKKVTALIVLKGSIVCQVIPFLILARLEVFVPQLVKVLLSVQYILITILKKPQALNTANLVRRDIFVMKMALETIVASLVLMDTTVLVKQRLNSLVQLELGDLFMLLEVLLNAILAQLDLIVKLMVELLMPIAKIGDFVIPGL